MRVANSADAEALVEEMEDPADEEVILAGNLVVHAN